jgi:hypothetical protein
LKRIIGPQVTVTYSQSAYSSDQRKIDKEETGIFSALSRPVVVSEQAQAGIINGGGGNSNPNSRETRRRDVEQPTACAVRFLQDVLKDTGIVTTIREPRQKQLLQTQTWVLRSERAGGEHSPSQALKSVGAASDIGIDDEKIKNDEGT